MHNIATVHAQSSPLDTNTQYVDLLMSEQLGEQRGMGERDIDIYIYRERERERGERDIL